MWRSKKFIITMILVAVVAVGSTVGVVLAQDDGSGTAQPQTIFEQAATILQGEGVSVTADQLQSAFTQARKAQQDEALNKRLQALVDAGKINQEQADQFKAWLAQKPDATQFQEQMKAWQQSRPTVPGELKDWAQSRPQLPGGVLGGLGPRGGMMGRGGMPRPFFGR